MIAQALRKGLVLATQNPNKIAEFQRLLAATSWKLETLPDPNLPPPVEDGQTAADNCRQKAIYYATQTCRWVLADDTVLEVEALNGEPGVRTARFAGPQATMQANRELLLTRMSHLPRDARHARFTCHLAIASPQGVIAIEAQGCCQGRITEHIASDQGFGYDRIFELVEYHRPLSDLSAAATDRIGHRGRAVERLLRALGSPPESSTHASMSERYF